MRLRDKLPYYLATIQKNLKVLFSTFPYGTSLKYVLPPMALPTYKAGKYRISFDGVQNATKWRWVMKLYGTNNNAIVSVAEANRYIDEWSIGYFNNNGFYVENNDGTKLTYTITIIKPCKVWFIISYGNVGANTTVINPKIEEVTT